MDGNVPAYSAELVLAFPVGDMGGGGASQALYGVHGAEGTTAHVFVTGGDLGGNIGGLCNNAIVQKEGGVVNAEKVMPFEIGQGLALKCEQFSYAGNAVGGAFCFCGVVDFQQGLSACIADKVVCRFRIADLELVEQLVGKNIVDHRFCNSWQVGLDSKYRFLPRVFSVIIDAISANT